MKIPHVLAALALLAVSSPAHAGFIGTTFDAAYYFSDPNTPYSGATFTPSSTFTVVDPGIEATLGIEGLTYMSIDFTDTRLTIRYESTTADPPTWANVAPNGPVFASLTPLGITGFTVDPSTTLAGFTASNVGFNDSMIVINWGGLTYAAGDLVVIDFVFVPEPSSIVAMAAGCVGLPLLAMVRRRRAA